MRWPLGRGGAPSRRELSFRRYLDSPSYNLPLHPQRQPVDQQGRLVGAGCSNPTPTVADTSGKMTTVHAGAESLVETLLSRALISDSVSNASYRHLYFIGCKGIP